MVEWKINHPQNVPGDSSVRPSSPRIRKPQTDRPGPSFSRILAARVAPAATGESQAPGINTLAVPHLQAVVDGCSVTSLMMVLNYYGIHPGSFEQYSQLVAAAPEQLHDLAEQFFGVRAGLVHNGSLNDLVNLIDHGIPPLIFGTEGGSGHCVVMSGYQRDATGQVTNIYLNDPNWPDGPRIMTSAEFQAFWEGGSDNEYMVLARPGTPQYDYLAHPQPMGGILHG